MRGVPNGMQGGSKGMNRISRWKRFDEANFNAWECPECGHVHQLFEGTPAENDMNYCPKCGVQLITIEKARVS